MRAKDIKPGQTYFISHCDVSARSDWRPCVEDGRFSSTSDVEEEVCVVYRDRESGQLVVQFPPGYKIEKSQEAARDPHGFVTVTLLIGTTKEPDKFVPEKLRHSRK